MPSLWDQLTEQLPSVLPRSAEQAVNGTDLLALVKPALSGDYADASIRQHFSRMAADSTSPIAKVDSGHGYYLRASHRNDRSVSTTAPTSNATNQDDNGELHNTGATRLGNLPEEKFRAVFMRFAELSENRFAMRLDHTRAERTEAGVNRWKFPDVILIDWDVGEITDDGYRLNRNLLEVRRSLGEQPFRLTSVELKVALNLSSFRESFFQCVSNSKWAHSAHLVVAQSVEDSTLTEELRRLGSSYDVTIESFSISPDYLASLPDAESIMRLSDQSFDEIVRHVQIRTIATGRPRSVLDWEHVRDMQARTPDFVDLFQWIAKCLEQARPFTYAEFRQLVDLLR